jgi:perosamine synthetase
MTDRIPVAGPWITDLEVTYVSEAARTAWYANANVFQEKFEHAFRTHLGVKHAVALPSCTSAIHLALTALGIGEGDEVIVPEITWIASAAPVDYVGATVVFADVDRETWCLSVDALRSCLTSRTRAVIPVDLYGGMPDMDGIARVAGQAGISVVEDAAQAIGAVFRGRRAGAFGDIGVFSFHGSKTVTTGEGGMLVTDRDDLAARVSVLRDHGRAAGDRMFWNQEVAYKYRMSSMQAALGLAQLERIDELIARKREIFGWYRAELERTTEVRLNVEPPDTFNTYWMVTAILDRSLSLQKQGVLEALRDQGIECRPFFHPLSSLPAYADRPQAAAARARNTVSYDLSPWGLNLPSGFNMTRPLVARVCAALKTLLRDAR